MKHNYNQELEDKVKKHAKCLNKLKHDIHELKYNLKKFAFFSIHMTFISVIISLFMYGPPLFLLGILGIVDTY